MRVSRQRGSPVGITNPRRLAFTDDGAVFSRRHGLGAGVGLWAERGGARSKLRRCKKRLKAHGRRVGVLAGRPVEDGSDQRRHCAADAEGSRWAGPGDWGLRRARPTWSRSAASALRLRSPRARQLACACRRLPLPSHATVSLQLPPDVALRSRRQRAPASVCATALGAAALSRDAVTSGQPSGRLSPGLSPRGCTSRSIRSIALTYPVSVCARYTYQR